MARKPCPTIYKNVTDDPESQKRAEFARKSLEELKASGFIFLGLLKICTNLRFRPEQAKQLISGQDGTILADVLENGEICVLLHSPDKRSFASIENYFGETIISLRTLLEDGTVIETTQKPSRQPQRADVIDEPQRITGLMISALMSSTIGPDQYWPRTNRPQAGYFVELMEPGDFNRLWQRHQERMAAIIPPEAAVRAHTSFELYLCLCQRSFLLVAHRGRVQWAVTNILFVIFFVTGLALLPAAWKWMSQAGIRTLTGVLLSLAGFIALGGLTMLARSAACRYLVDKWPGPPLVPASELMRLVKSWFKV